MYTRYWGKVSNEKFISFLGFIVVLVVVDVL